MEATGEAMGYAAYPICHSIIELCRWIWSATDGKGKAVTNKRGIYGSWCAMKQRCFNVKNHAYQYYGGRGITVCDRWMSYSNFAADMGERPHGHSLDRIDNDGNYDPSNCRWATVSEQAANRRPSERPMKICIAPDCKRRVRARGLCHPHYMYARQLVSEKQTTWEDLVKAGKATGVSRPRHGEFTKWLLGK